MRVLIRTDASVEIGSGHLMRCLTLADALKQRGVQIRFISRHLPEHLREMIAAKQHEFMPLDSYPSEAIASDVAHAHWLGTSQHADVQDSIQALSDQTWDWLVVDHYALDARWESALRQMVKNILVIDDIADRRHDCDILLDQNFYADMDIRYTGKVPAHCRLLLGPRYALLREEFRQLHEQTKPRTEPVKRILVFFGGVDADNYTGRVVKALASLGIGGLHVDVVIGAQHPCREQIESACAEYEFDCHVQTNRMAELMAAADMAIGAGGSATWERCCLGLPTLAVSLADNQIKIATALDSFGAGKYVGSQDTASITIICKAVLDLLQNRSQLKVLSEKAYSMVDGLGVDRLCNELIC
jgi:UDP-2,4-diacetamido-2,4,6-trideoxy-beta-L-altropyranose hydrolase